ncbi:MAG: hypothetical protein OHK0015_04420 [Chloroflexi bacterium OHK40]
MHAARLLAGALLAALTLGALLLPSPARAQSLTVDGADNPLAIRGTLDGETTAFSGNVRLIADVDVDELQLLASELTREGDPTTIIDRSNVSIPTGTTLRAGQPRDVRVTVANVRRPGTYTGELRFLLPDQPLTSAIAVPLQLQVDARPDVQPATPAMSLRLMRCGWFLDCALGRLLLHPTATLDTWPLQLDNRTDQTVVVTNTNLVLVGEGSGLALGPGEILISVPRELAPRSTQALTMTVARAQIAPDRYKGHVDVVVERGASPARVTLEIAVREGPFWALVAICAGVVIGRLVRGQQTPAVQLQFRQLERLNRARAQLGRVSDQELVRLYGASLLALERAIAAGQESEEAIAARIAQAEAVAEYLVSLDDIKQHLIRNNYTSLLERLQPAFQAAGKLAVQGQIEAANAKRQEIEDALVADSAMGEGDDALVHSRTSGSRLAEAAEPAEQRPRRFDWLAQLLAALTGSPVAGLHWRYWLLRPLLYLLLLGLLMLVGLQTLYVNNGVTFGAAGLFDYLGLILWGLSADVAQRTLQDLQPMRVGG